MPLPFSLSSIINQVMEINREFNFMQVLTGRWWGADPNNQIIVYEASVHGTTKKRPRIVDEIHSFMCAVLPLGERRQIMATEVNRRE